MDYNENLMREALNGKQGSFNELKSNADAGDAEAQFFIALYYEKTGGINNPDCQYWMKKAFDNGYQGAEEYLHEEQIEENSGCSDDEVHYFLKSFFMRFSFVGRIGRREYIISVVILFAAVFLIGKIENSSVQAFLNLAVDWFFLSQTARRFHDFGESGWWALVPVISWIWALFPKGINET